MQVLAAAAPATTTFFHAGYLSAGPHPFTYPNASWEQSAKIIDTGTPLDVAVALQLQGETLPASPPAAEVSLPERGDAGVDVLASAVGVAAAFLVLVALLYVARVWGTWRRLAWASFVLVALLLVAAVLLPPMARRREAAFRPPALPPANAPAPWEGVPPRAYADPPTATLALMHGIVADALANAWWPVESLGQLRNEVGLPVKDLTEGERYALQTYGLDGWGRPFRLEQHVTEPQSAGVTGREAAERRARGVYYGPYAENTPNPRQEAPHYALASAGADGAFDTGDDVVVEVPNLTDYTWDSYVPAPFLYKAGHRLLWLRHRWPGRTSRYNAEAWARLLTGGPLFDATAADSLGGRLLYIRDPGGDNEEAVDVRSKVPELYEQVAAGKPRPPLVLVVPPAAT